MDKREDNMTHLSVINIRIRLSGGNAVAPYAGTLPDSRKDSGDQRKADS